jgi:PII-like signaling protein
MQPAKLIEIYCSEQDRYDGKPLYEAIVERCRELRIAGATVLRGLEGYGETSAIHRHRALKHDQPITVIVVDSASKVQALTLAVEGMFDKGMMTLSDVSARRVQSASAVSGADGEEPS